MNKQFVKRCILLFGLCYFATTAFLFAARIPTIISEHKKLEAEIKSNDALLSFVQDNVKNRAPEAKPQLYVCKGSIFTLYGEVTNKDCRIIY